MPLTEQQAKDACKRIMGFTPGPWNIEWSKHEPTEIDPNPENRHAFDIVQGGNWETGWVGCVNHQFTSYENGMANARLIAAAPDMFTFLTDIHAHLTAGGNLTQAAQAEIVGRIDELLKKVQG